MVKRWMMVVTILVVLVIGIPTLLVFPFTKEKVKGQEDKVEQVVEKHKQPYVAVFRSKTQVVEDVPLEEYVTGVVASEMPATFEVEALKAQAISARTYIVKKLLKNDALENNANVSDTTQYQVYNNQADLKKQWGSTYAQKIKKVEDAVKETEGQVIAYKGEPIVAPFFSMSNGYTENAEEVWGTSYPYLKSVPSQWDKNIPNFSSEKTIPLAEFQKQLGITVNKDGSIGTISSTTTGNRVNTVSFNGKILKATDIRTKLGLRSTDFAWVQKGTDIVITTKGYGHGVGMSQYGANEMAMQGKKATDILAYYYIGTEMTSVSQFTNKMTVKVN